MSTSATGSDKAARRAFAVLLASLACLAPARADSGTEQVALAASGRYDLLEQMLEAQAARAPLDVRDRHALCYAYSRTKRYGPLLACLDQLEQALRQPGDHATRLFALDDATPALGVMRAEAQIELGQYPEAAATARRTLDWLKAERSDDLDMVFNSQAALAIAQVLAGQRSEAQELAAQLARAGTGLTGDYAGARTLALARVRMALGDYAGVLSVLEGDKQFGVNVFLDRLFSGGYFTGVNNWVWAELPRAFMFNKALLETGRVSAAKAGLERLLALPQVRANGEIYWLLLNERGRIADREQDLAGALDWYLQALEVVEQQRASIDTEASKIGFVGDKQALYHRAVDAALALGRTESAYELMERSKSRALVDLLAGRGASPVLPQSAGSGRLLAGFQASAAQAHVQLPLDMARGGDDQLAAWRDQARQLKAGDPALASLVSVNSLSLQQVRAHLHADEVLVEYYLSGQQLVLVAVDAGRQISAVADGAGLEEEVRRLRQLIEQQDGAALAAGQALYRKLLAPVAAMIAGRPLLIVPHGALHYLPFGALHDGQDYLLATHQLRFLPSASVQHYLRAPRAQAIDNILIFGNPDLGRAAWDLPSAETEARLIADLLPVHRVVTRKAASETEFKRNAGAFRYLHLAVHGEFKGDAPLASRLMLAADGDNDGSLTVAEVYGLRLDAELVTLSACETGLSSAMSGDDMVGLARGFLYAGSSNIIASLWPVDDKATAVLMTAFYRNLKRGESKAAALRHAQQALQARYPQPVYWAAFYLTGHGV
ncbi:CHAT domain-containing protein [Oxalobacteraceae bacterium A2-2]